MQPNRDCDMYPGDGPGALHTLILRDPPHTGHPGSESTNATADNRSPPAAVATASETLFINQKHETPSLINDRFRIAI